jgi:hypothetical protein
VARADRLSELDQTRVDYWRELVRYMGRRKSLIMFNEPSSKHQLRAKAETFGSGKFILVALANVMPSRIGVGVELSGTKDYYAALETDNSRIQKEIGCEHGNRQKFHWNPETKVRDIWLYWDTDFRERQQWSEQHEWLGDKLEAFQRVLEPRITELLRASA